MAQVQENFYEAQIDRIYDETPVRAEHYEHIKQSRAFMVQHHFEQLDLDALAKSAFMSRFHYVRVFQRVYGVTPRAYLRDIRIEKAKSLLRQDLPITQVCFDIGYESISTFSSVFKKCVGCTPKQYARDNQEPDSPQ
ncbi:AraC family transcriptional regulator [Psychrobium sp. MM17-31]|uniref:helix-turn-helix transcriptional regulator n=1 Tax=Psychrobium sp. MM17-31 TaxID=2917758 RepID=UPI001EF6291A|nr:AraC family transcriptional regulator [Psychrobium sp. MM17-31]MCG7530782.1 AraC family transcriptional regulator [Psychrobium sp. MM17-31]